MRFRFAALAALTLCGIATAAGDTGKDSDTKDKPARPRIRFGGIMINAGYSRVSGPGYYPYYGGYGPWSPYGYGPYAYNPFFFGPYMHPGFFTGFGYGPNLGEIKLKTEDRDAWVYLDGALAGKAERLKSMWLEPGKYDLEVRSGEKRFGQKVYVLSGKTLRLTADPVRSEVRP
jgi:hypothetical protein